MLLDRSAEDENLDLDGKGAGALRSLYAGAALCGRGVRHIVHSDLCVALTWLHRHVQPRSSLLSLDAGGGAGMSSMSSTRAAAAPAGRREGVLEV